MVNFWDLYIFIFDNFVLGTSTFGEGFYLYIVFGLLSFMSFLIASALLVILSVYSLLVLPGTSSLNTDKL